VAGVLAFSVSARTREFGVRLAMGSAPRQVLTSVLSEGGMIAAIGILAGAAGGCRRARLPRASRSGERRACSTSSATDSKVTSPRRPRAICSASGTSGSHELLKGGMRAAVIEEVDEAKPKLLADPSPKRRLP
jgi:hypothetical protein